MAIAIFSVGRPSATAAPAALAGAPAVQVACQPTE
jgi:hypothetical protein